MRLFFGLLFFCFVNASGQDIFFQKDSSVVKRIEGLPSMEPFDTTDAYRKVKQRYVYIISKNDLYRIFDYNTAMKLYGFNFADYHILGQQLCIHCYRNCNHNGVISPCHRNACDYEWIWQMRENKIAFVEIPSTTKAGHVDANLPEGRTSFFYDTLIRSGKDIINTNWYTHGHGDCFARFKYGVFHDTYYNVVLLKEWNHWGGCRAGGSKTFTISFVMPQNVVQRSKSIILMKNYGDEPED